MCSLSGKTRKEKTLIRKRSLFSLSFIALIFFVDQIIKLAVLSSLPEGASHSVLFPFFYLTRVNNQGAAFGMFTGATVFLSLFSFVAVVGIILYLSNCFRKINPTWFPKSDLEFLAWSLIAGGALGNLYDRIKYSYVIDYLDFRVWPVFNFADSCITVGAIFVAFKYIVLTKEKKK